MSTDSMSVQGRLYVEPAKLTGLTADLKLGVYTDTARTQSVHTLFETHFSNKVSVVSMEQQGPLGARLRIAVKADLSGMDTENLVFYSYDRATNQFKRIENPEYHIDSVGYLHFYTDQGGSVIISDGALTQ